MAALSSPLGCPGIQFVDELEAFRQNFELAKA